LSDFSLKLSIYQFGIFPDGGVLNSFPTISHCLSYHKKAAASATYPTPPKHGHLMDFAAMSASY
jgi:hypothetical protein